MKRQETKPGCAAPTSHSHVCSGDGMAALFMAKGEWCGCSSMFVCHVPQLLRPSYGETAEFMLLSYPPKSQKCEGMTHLLSLGPEDGVAATDGDTMSRWPWCQPVATTPHLELR